MLRKTDQAIALFKAGNIKDALRISKTFTMGITYDQRKVLVNGYEAFIRPEWYSQLGKDPEKLRLDGATLFYTLFIRKS